MDALEAIASRHSEKAYCSKLYEMLGVPAGFKAISLLPLGYGAAKGTQKPRRDLAQVIHWGKF